MAGQNKSFYVHNGLVVASQLTVDSTGNLYTPGIITSTIHIITGTTGVSSTNTGALQVAGGVGVAGGAFFGGVVTATNMFIGPWAVSTGSSLANISPYSGIFTITNTTVSISTNTGALQVTGGAGIGGNINVGGNAAIINVPPVTQTYGGVLQVGTTLNFSDTNIISSFAENTNTYAQVVLQNLNGGSSSSADFILNNNSTTGASIYGDFGINGTGYSGIDPFSDPSGTYLYGAGGTLSIGTPNAFNFKVATNNTVALTITPDQNARFVGIVTATNMFIGPWAVSTGTGVLSVANALTINNGGSGAASGSTFNGSSPVTISYNSIGAPSTGGTNATGTWNIVAGTALIANSVSNLLTINSAGVGAASPQTYNGGSALTISYNTIGAPSTGGTNATGTWNIVAGSAVTATYAAVAYSLANTATTQVGYAATATSAAVAYSLANTSTIQVGYAVNATNLINTASTLVGYANYAYGFNTSTLVTNAVTALNASNINTVLQTASASYYPTFVNANNASPAAGSLYTTSSFSINPATGLVSYSTSTISVNGWTLGINPSGVPTTSTTTATSYPTGFYAANLYSSSGYPSSYGYLQSMSSNYANSMAQTYFSWTGYGDQTGSAGQPAYMWVRTNRDSNNQFGAWQQVLLLQQNGDLSLGTAHSYGSGNMNMSGIFTSTNTTNASSTITGALQVAGGVGIGGNLYVGGKVVAQELDIQYTTVTTQIIVTPDVFTITNTTNASSTITGALVVAGGVGVQGSMYVGGNFTPSTVYNTGTGAFFFGNSAWNGSTPANSNIDAVTGIVYNGGVGSQLFTFSSAPGQLSVQLDGSIFVGDVISYNPASTSGVTNGSLLASGNITAGGNLYIQGIMYGTATNVAGGAAGSLHIQSGAGTTTMLPIGANATVLQSNGSTATWVAPSTLTAGTATNVAGGAAGSLHIQSGAGTTTMLPIGAAGTLLQSNGTTATWVAPSTLTAGTATNVAGGAAGSLHIQSGAGTTTMLPIGAAGTLLQSNGTTATWVTSSTITANAVTNSLTINNGGAGSASGSTFNGSGAITISYNSIGAPSTTGANATGTWNIVAGTANNATNLGGVAASSYLTAVKFGQLVVTTSITLSSTHYGANVLLNGSNLTITLPASASSGTVISLSNISSTNVTLSYTGTNGSDGPSTLQPQNSIMLISDGGSPSYWRQYFGSPGYLTAGAGLGNTQINSLGVGTAASGTAGEIRATGNVSAYYSSDARLKENIQEIPNALAALNKIRGVSFDWTEEFINERGGEDEYFMRKHDIGVIAQEIQEVLPEVVAEREDGYLAVKYDRIVALLIQAIKEQQKQIDELKNK